MLPVILTFVHITGGSTPGVAVVPQYMMKGDECYQFTQTHDANADRAKIDMNEIGGKPIVLSYYSCVFVTEDVARKAAEMSGFKVSKQ